MRLNVAEASQVSWKVCFRSLSPSWSNTAIIHPPFSSTVWVNGLVRSGCPNIRIVCRAGFKSKDVFSAHLQPKSLYYMLLSPCEIAFRHLEDSIIWNERPGVGTHTKKLYEYFFFWLVLECFGLLQLSWMRSICPLLVSHKPKMLPFSCTNCSFEGMALQSGVFHTEPVLDSTNH